MTTKLAEHRSKEGFFWKELLYRNLPKSLTRLFEGKKRATIQK